MVRRGGRTLEKGREGVGSAIVGYLFRTSAGTKQLLCLLLDVDSAV